MLVILVSFRCNLALIMLITPKRNVGAISKSHLQVFVHDLDTSKTNTRDAGLLLFSFKLFFCWFCILGKFKRNLIINLDILVTIVVKKKKCSY